MNVINNVTQQNTVTIDGRQFRGQSEEQKTIDLRNGSQIQGKVMSITENNGEKIATLNVGDAVISAKVSDGMGLREGQTLNFAVTRSSTSGGVSITPLYENTSVDQSTLKALMAAGIEINNDTVQMVKEMMGAGLPIGKDALLEMNKNLSAYPNTSISTLVEMKSLNIPINDLNVTQFENYKNYEHQVTTAMESIMDELPDAFNELVAKGQDSQALDLYGSVLKLFGGEEGEEGAQGQAVSQDAEMQNVVKEMPNAEAEQTVNVEGRTLTADGKVIITDDQSLVAEGQIENADAKQAGVNGKMVGPDGQVLNPDGKKVSPDAKSPEALAPQENAPAQTPSRQMPVISHRFANELKNLGVPEETIKEYENALREVNTSKAQNANSGEASQEASTRLENAQKDLLKSLSASFEKADISDPAQAKEWKNLFSSNEYNKLLKDNISSQWLLKPGDVEKKENIENLYQRLNNQVKGLTSAIEQNLGADSRLGQTANNLQNNLNFMDQLNQMFQYVQLPLQMTGQNVHGDLYVYKNKHKKMSEDGSVSAVLHLDMENLGPVDVYVKLIDTKVSTNFYVADESVLGLINDNIHILNERLEKRGYSMNVKMMLHDEMDGQDAAVDEMLDVSKTPVISTASFDARA
jgi:hypothetical protein